MVTRQAQDLRTDIKTLVEGIRPHDKLELQHQAEVVAWIDSGAPLFREVKPDKPPKHLVSYFVLIDSARSKILLVDHIKAQLWAPTGGHVEPGEHPLTTVEREVQEELAINAVFSDAYGAAPMFVTSTVTVGLTPGHTDVSLWYVLEGDSDSELSFDAREFKTIKWYSFDEVMQMDVARLDPNLHRFIAKLNEKNPHK